MSKLHLIQEIETTIKMVSNDYDRIKLTHYLDDLLSNYKIQEKELSDIPIDNQKYLKMYLDTLTLQNYSESTISVYTYQLNSFMRSIDKSILHTTTSDIREFLSSFEDNKTSTIVTKLDILSGLFNWLVLEDELLKNPCAKIKRPKIPKRVREGLSVVELEKVRVACNTARERCILEVFYSTGCRLNEVRMMNTKDIDWSEGSIMVIGKGDKERKVYLSEKAIWYIKQYLDTRNDDCEALITSERTPIRRLTREGIQYQIKKIKERASLNKPFHCHTIRRTFAQSMLNAGVDIVELKDILGHSKLDTTLIYAQATNKKKEQAFRQYHQQ